MNASRSYCPFLLLWPSFKFFNPYSMFLHKQMEETDCNSKLNSVFQMLSNPTASSSTERNCHVTPKYTHNDGLKGIVWGLSVNIFHLNLVFITSVFCFCFVFYFFMYLFMFNVSCHWCIQLKCKQWFLMLLSMSLCCFGCVCVGCCFLLIPPNLTKAL